MRKLMYFATGFAIACGLCSWILPKVNIQTAMYISFLLGIALMCFSRRKILMRVALVFLGCGTAFFWFLQYDSHYLKNAAKLDGMTQSAAIRVSDYSYETAYGIAFDGMIILEGKQYQIKTYLKDLEGVEPGNMVTGEFRFRLTTPDGAESSVYHQGKGIFLMAYQRGDVQVSKGEAHWLDKVARLRLNIKERLCSVFSEDTYPFALALLLGDGNELDYALDTAFKLSGISHIIAVSGQHVMLVFAVISTLTLHKRFLTALVGVPVLILFSALTGFTPSVVRACLMTGLMMMGMVLDKEYDSATGLSFASLVILILNPLSITSVSFQLSAGSVVGIYLFQEPIRQWLLSGFPVKKERKFLRKIINWFASSTAVTLSAIPVTVPLCAVHFGAVSFVSVLTNLLTLWIVGILFYGIIVVCFLGFVSASAATFLAGILSYPIRYVLFAASALADFPLAAVYTRSVYITAWLVFVYILLMFFLIMKNKHPHVLVCCAALGLCVSLLFSWMEPMLCDFRFTVLDVGQGQCLLIQCDGQTYMVDCGGDSDTVTADVAAETLLSQGITRLDGLILTHLDRDHAGAAANLLSRVDTKLLILPPAATELSKWTEGEVIYAAQNLSLGCNDMEIKIFAPLFPGNSNEMSLSILFDTKKCDILITGDRNGFGERSLLRYEKISDVDILVAGHHGSKNSTCAELLQAVQPEIVCISAGRDNSYGHPAPELLQRLYDYGCMVYRTDLHGTIEIRR